MPYKYVSSQKMYQNTIYILYALTNIYRYLNKIVTCYLLNTFCSMLSKKYRRVHIAIKIISMYMYIIEKIAPV